MAFVAATNRTTTTTRAPSSGNGGGSQSYLSVAIALPLTLAVVVIAMGLLRWKIRSAAARRSSTYLDRRCQKNSKAPPPYADAQQLASAPQSAAIGAVRPKLGSRRSATLPRLPRAPDVRRLPPGFWTVGRALSSGSSGSGGGLAASTSLPCLCPDEEAIAADLWSHSAAAPPAGGGDGSSSNSPEDSSAKIVVAIAAAALLSPDPAATAANDPQPLSPVAASAVSLRVAARDDGTTALPVEEDDGGAIAARAWLAVSSIERIDEEEDYDVAASNDGVVSDRSAPTMAPHDSAIGARCFALSISMPEIVAAADDQAVADNEMRQAEKGSDGEPACTLRSNSRRRSSDAAAAASAADAEADTNSPAVRSPLGLAFRSTPIFMDDLVFEPTP